MKKTSAALFAAVLLVGLLSVSAGCTGTTSPEQTEIPVSSAGPAENVVDANNMFAFDIYKKIASENSENDNLFLSPFSISSALALTYEGAKGKTSDEIRAVFHFPGDIDALRNGYLELNADINAGDPEYELSVANALWAEKTYPFLDSYINTAREYYSANTTNLDFVNHPEESRLIINEWAEEKTKDRIKDLIPAGMIDQLTALVISNAIYFKGTWVLQFDENKTAKADFTTPSGEMVPVDMMQRTDEEAVYGYAETDELQVLKMPYEHETGKELSMLVLLPKENDLQAIEDALDADKLREINDSIDTKQVKVFFPKYKLETDYELSDTLAEMGMPTAFSDADFSGMDGIGGLFISNVIHKAFVEVNEEGTEAAAATAVIFKRQMTQETIPEFRADHPFIFLIQDDETGNILFIGRISNPVNG